MEHGEAAQEEQSRRREILDGARHIGGTIVGLGWLAAFTGLLITVNVRADLAQAPTEPSAHWAALATPLLLCAVGVGVAGLGHLLRALPAICGMADESGPRPRNLSDFIQSMRARQD